MIDSIIKHYMDFVKPTKNIAKNKTFWVYCKEWLDQIIKTIIFLVGTGGLFWIIRHF